MDFSFRTFAARAKRMRRRGIATTTTACLNAQALRSADYCRHCTMTRKSCIGCLSAIERHLAATRPPICEGVAAADMLAAYDGGRSATSPQSCFRRRNHGAMAKQYCPSSSTVARQFGMRYRRQVPPISPGASPRDLAAQHGSVDAVRMNFPTPVRSAQEENP